MTASVPSSVTVTGLIVGNNCGESGLESALVAADAGGTAVTVVIGAIAAVKMNVVRQVQRC